MHKLSLTTIGIGTLLISSNCTAPDNENARPNIVIIFADDMGYDTGHEGGEDSFSLWPVLQGEAYEPVRTSMIHHSSGRMYGIRNSNRFEEVP